MDLKTFFKKNPDWTKHKFAHEVGSQVVTVYTWINGKVPHLDKALKIQEVTQGQVKLEDLLRKK